MSGEGFSVLTDQGGMIFKGVLTPVERSQVQAGDNVRGSYDGSRNDSCCSGLLIIDPEPLYLQIV